jgi:hypothetical protein
MILKRLELVMGSRPISRPIRYPASTAGTISPVHNPKLLTNQKGEMKNGNHYRI